MNLYFQTILWNNIVDLANSFNKHPWKSPNVTKMLLLPGFANSMKQLKEKFKMSNFGQKRIKKAKISVIIDSL